MGKQWDKAIPSIDIWKECLRILKPGAFAFIMCIPRQDCLSRMIVSLDNAGFNINFTSLYHVFASGFPKAMSISKAVDKRLGAKRKILGYAERFGREGRKANCGFKEEYVGASGTQNQPAMKVIDKPATSQAKALDGSYAGFSPKPALEVILVAMKPIETKTYIDQAIKNGHGIVWFDDCKIPYKQKDIPQAGLRTKTFGTKTEPISGGNGSGGYKADNQGRFPANILISDNVLNDGSKQSQGHWSKTKTTGYGKFGGGKSEYSGVGRKEPYTYKGHRYKVEGFIKDNKPQAPSNYNDCGSFSRYFSLDAWWDEKIKYLPDNVKKTFPFLIAPKASKSEKNRGCKNLYWEKDNSDFGYHQVNKEKWEWLEQEEKRIFKETKERTSLKAQGNIHVTTKPIKLMSYLIVLGSRKGDIILDPFAGSGTTLIAAKMLNRQYIGYEINKEYYEIAKKRLDVTLCQGEFNFGT